MPKPVVRMGMAGITAYVSGLPSKYSAVILSSETAMLAAPLKLSENKRIIYLVFTHFFNHFSNHGDTNILTLER